MVDYVREMMAEKSCSFYGKYGIFERLLLLSVCAFFVLCMYTCVSSCYVYGVKLVDHSHYCQLLVKKILSLVLFLFKAVLITVEGKQCFVLLRMYV